MAWWTVFLSKNTTIDTASAAWTTSYDSDLNWYARSILDALSVLLTQRTTHPKRDMEVVLDGAEYGFTDASITIDLDIAVTFGTSDRYLDMMAALDETDKSTCSAWKRSVISSLTARSRSSRRRAMMRCPAAAASPGRRP